jgi:hypothetical protein
LYFHFLNRITNICWDFTLVCMHWQQQFHNLTANSPGSTNCRSTICTSSIYQRCKLKKAQLWWPDRVLYICNFALLLRMKVQWKYSYYYNISNIMNLTLTHCIHWPLVTNIQYSQFLGIPVFEIPSYNLRTVKKMGSSCMVSFKHYILL